MEAYSEIPLPSHKDLKISRVTLFMNVINNRVQALELASEALSDPIRFPCILAALFASQ